MLYNFDKFFYCSLSVNLTCIHTHPQIVEIFSFLMENEHTSQGTHIDAVGPYSLQISDYSPYYYLSHYVTVISKKNLWFSLKNAFYSLQLHSLPRKITHLQTVIRQKLNQIWLLPCRYFFPMPQLTTDSDRVVVIYIALSDVMDFKILHMMRLHQMMMEIKISDDYCRSDIYVADYDYLTLRLISKIKS